MKCKIARRVMICVALGAVAAAAPAFTGVLEWAPPTMSEAQALMQKQDFAGAAAAYREITQAQPSNEQAWFMLGFALHSDGKLDEAIEAHKKGETFTDPQLRATATYNLGCAYALQGKKDDAFAALQRSVDLGITNKAQFQGDADLASLKADARWNGLMERLDQTGELPKALHFWVGDWDVYNTAGVLNGHNTLESRVGGHVIHESWTPLGGGSKGESWNWYDPSTRLWHQVWVDVSGLSMDFKGGSHAQGGILFEGTQVASNGTATMVRMHVRPIGPGRIQQTGTGSVDQGKTWQPRFDLIYVAKGEPFAPSDATEPDEGGAIGAAGG